MLTILFSFSKDEKDPSVSYYMGEIKATTPDSN
jgi:hypothetical protein